MHVILKPSCRYNLCTCMIPSAIFLIFRFFIVLNVANIMFCDMSLRKQILFIFMISQKMVNSFYLSRISLVILGILTGSTCWILSWTVFLLLSVVFWVHIYPQPFQHLIVGLEGYTGYYYQFHEGFYLLFDQWCAGISFRDRLFLCHGWCIISSCP